MFQSTRPHGARHAGPHGIARHVEFQSTRPHGARPCWWPGAACRTVVSIHAPARGATPEARGGRGHGPVSIHAPARGATTVPRSVRTGPRVSIHAPARGATWGCHRSFLVQQFQSTRPHGARRARARLPRPWPRFNPRARTGRDLNEFGAAKLPDVFQSTRPHGARPCHLTYTYNNANIHPKCDYPA